MLGLALAWLVSACATPVAPTGGPPDRTPPAVIATEPEAGATRVTPAAVLFEFSEWVDEASFARAFSITPALQGRLAFDWGRRSVRVVFPEALREQTTYVITLDTNLRDANGVALSEPFAFAFSTGETIDRGRLAGRVVSPRTEEGIAAVDVFAYAAPDSLPPSPLPAAPDYRTQTDPQGQFAFGYLSEQPYYVVALQDQNRNAQPDRGEAFAAPPRAVLLADTSAATLLPDSTSAATLLPPGSASAAADPVWFITRIDTTPPALQRATPLSERRFDLRFSEPVALLPADTTAWTLRDTVTGATVAARPYQTLDDPFTVHLETDALPARPFALRWHALADTSGNAPHPADVVLTPATGADTLALRFRGYLPDTLTASADGVYLLPPRTEATLRFNQPVDSTTLRALVRVADTTGAALPYRVRARTDGTTYELRPVAGSAGAPFVVTLGGPPLVPPDTTYERRFAAVTADDLGEITGIALAPDSADVLVVELFRASELTSTPYRSAIRNGPGPFRFEALPPGLYRLRLFVDSNRDGRWDGGRLAPYLPPEPLGWSPGETRARARWETSLPEPLRIGGPLPAPPAAELPADGSDGDEDTF